MVALNLLQTLHNYIVFFEDIVKWLLWCGLPIFLFLKNRFLIKKITKNFFKIVFKT